MLEILPAQGWVSQSRLLRVSLDGFGVTPRTETPQTCLSNQQEKTGSGDVAPLL